jgi:hypothetical protein
VSAFMVMGPTGLLGLTPVCSRFATFASAARVTSQVPLGDLEHKQPKQAESHPNEQPS